MFNSHLTCRVNLRNKKHDVVDDDGWDPDIIVGRDIKPQLETSEMIDFLQIRIKNGEDCIDTKTEAC